MWFTDYWKQRVRKQLRHLLPEEVFGASEQARLTSKLARLVGVPKLGTDVVLLSSTLEAAVEEILREIRDATESLQLSEGYCDGIESSNRRLQDEIAALERILSRGGSAARV